MIKQIAKDKILFALFCAAAFAISYLIQLNLIIPILLVSLYAYVKVRRQEPETYHCLNISLLFLIQFASGFFILREGLPIYYIPFALVPMLATLLFKDLELALLISLAGSASTAAFSHNPFQLFLVSFTSGIVSSLLVHNARKRVTVIRCGVIVGIVQAASYVCMDLAWLNFSEKYLLFLVNLLLNGFACSIIILGVLPIFEYLFRAVTNISLLELADFNHPLLQRMVLEAPGTYHHSLIVGNLSDSACRAVGANALLARIGAYYHDIGKLEKAEYFSENQAVSESKHDTLSPSMSKLIIMNHVKDRKSVV